MSSVSTPAISIWNYKWEIINTDFVGSDKKIIFLWFTFIHVVISNNFRLDYIRAPSFHNCTCLNIMMQRWKKKNSLFGFASWRKKREELVKAILTSTQDSIVWLLEAFRNLSLKLKSEINKYGQSFYYLSFRTKNNYFVSFKCTDNEEFMREQSNSQRNTCKKIVHCDAAHCIEVEPTKLKDARAWYVCGSFGEFCQFATVNVRVWIKTQQ